MDYLILQLEEERVTAARFTLSRTRATLGGAAVFEFSPELPPQEALRRIATGVAGSPEIVLCLPPSLFAQRVVELPLRERRKAREVLPALLQGELALPVEELLLDALPAGDGRYLAVWARCSEVARYLELFQQAGLDPRQVSSVPFAWGALPGIPADCAVCDGGALGILRDGQLTYLRSFSPGQASPEAAATLAALELSGGVRPERLCLVGRHGLDPADLARFVPEVVPLAAPPDQGLLFRNQAAFDDLAGLYAVARSSFDRTLPDFRQRELAWRPTDGRLRRKLYLTAVLGAALVLLLFGGKLMQYRTARADLASLNRSISAIYREIFPGRAKAIDELSEVKGEIRKLAGLESEASFLDLLKQLAEAKGSTISGLYEIELDGRTVRLKGDARSAQQANEFKAALSRQFSGVELGEVKGRPDGSVSFSLSATLKEVRR